MDEPRTGARRGEAGGRHARAADRPSRRFLDRIVAGRASSTAALVVHSHDVDHVRHFPNARRIADRAARPGDVAAEPPYAAALAAEPAGSRPLVLCTGLLEHVEDPFATVAALARVLAPGGLLILSASGVFAYHGAPRNYFHFAPGGLRLVLERQGLQVEAIRGSTGPFATLGMLAERIPLQCDAPAAIRALAGLLRRALPPLDRFVGEQRPGRDADHGAGIMPATLVALARKPGAAADASARGPEAAP